MVIIAVPAPFARPPSALIIEAGIENATQHRTVQPYNVLVGMRRAFRIYVANETKKRLDAALADNLERSRKGERIIRNLDLERLLLASQAFCGWLFVFPALIGFTLFYFLPTIRAFYIGLTNWNLMRVPKFLGLENYQKLMADQRFWESMWVTLLYS